MPAWIASVLVSVSASIGTSVARVLDSAPAPSGARTIALESDSDSVSPREASWDELVTTVFDPAWILPEALAIAPGAPASGDEPAIDLVADSRRMIAMRWEPVAGDPHAIRCFGDLARAVGVGGDEATRERVCASIAKSRPQAWRELAAAARELLTSDILRTKRWDPDRDDRRDGIRFAHPLTLAGRAEPPWSGIEGSELVQQASVLVFADLDAIKAVENDYRAYPARPGSSYEAIHPLPDTYLRGVDADGAPFAALRIHFRCDLPFPFGRYRCDLSILNRTGPDGTLRCDIYSRSRDFLWLAGRDTFIPVRASDGAWVATLVVRWFGFDLRGVPDGDDARRAGLRSSLGSLKREAEARFAASGSHAREVEATVPPFEVRGARR